MGAALSTEIVHHREGDMYFHKRTGSWREYTAGWHPHFHAALICEGRLDYADTIEAAERSLPGQASCHFDEITEPREVVEWCKYGLKYGDEPWDVDAWSEAVETLHKRQLMQSFGSLRGYEAPDRPRVPPDWTQYATIERIPGQHPDEGDWVYYPPREAHVPLIDCRTDNQKAAQLAAFNAGKPDCKPPHEGALPSKPRKKNDWQALKAAVLNVPEFVV